MKRVELERIGQQMDDLKALMQQPMGSSTLVNRGRYYGIFIERLVQEIRSYKVGLVNLFM